MLDGNESDNDLALLSNDIFDYFKGHNNKTFISLNYKNNFNKASNELSWEKESKELLEVYRKI